MYRCELVDAEINARRPRAHQPTFSGRPALPLRWYHWVYGARAYGWRASARTATGKGTSMVHHAFDLPLHLKREAERLAERQGLTLDQFIVAALAEKVDALGPVRDDPRHPHVALRRGAAGEPVPVVRGTGIRIQALAVATRRWGMTPAEAAAEYGLTAEQVAGALAFADAHAAEIDAAMAAEERMAPDGEADRAMTAPGRNPGCPGALDGGGPDRCTRSGLDRNGRRRLAGSGAMAQ
jgi:uncharacterized protein (DUF433 family)